MNTNRDNFHDWARDKPDTTSFSGLHRSEMQRLGRRPGGVRWLRLLGQAALGVALIAAFRFLTRL